MNTPKTINKMYSHKYFIASAALMLAASLTGCQGKADAVVEEEDNTPVVDVDVVHSVVVPHKIQYTANVEAENINNISPSASNRIRTITVDVGDHVTAGQTLVTLDAANADQQRINLEQTEREYNRAVELLNIGSGTQRAVDQYKAQLDAQRTQYENTMQNTVLTSPISGVVIARNYDPGDMTGSQPVLTVGQITPSVKVVINVNETDITRVSRGTVVDITFDAFAGETFTGRVTRIAPSVDVSTRTFTAEVSLANPGGRILPGMFARVEVNLGDRVSVVVPDRAIEKQKGSNNKYVYVYSNGTVSYRRVEPGLRLDNGYELLSGINEGDTVVIAGQSRLVDGAVVRLNNK